MRYNNYYVTKKFEEEWKILERLYAEAGMSQQSINEMKKFDWDVKKKERVYYSHNRPLPNFMINGTECDEAKVEMIDRYIDEIAYEADSFVDGEMWIEHFECEVLYSAMEKLSCQERRILRMICLEGYYQKDVAEELGISQQAISKKLKKIKRKVKSNCNWLYIDDA